MYINIYILIDNLAINDYSFSLQVMDPTVAWRWVTAVPDTSNSAGRDATSRNAQGGGPVFDSRGYITGVAFCKEPPVTSRWHGWGLVVS